MRRLLIPILAMMLMGPAFAVVTGTVVVTVNAHVDEYCAIEADPLTITLDPNPSPGARGWATSYLGVHSNSNATLTVTKLSGIFTDTPAWDTTADVYYNSPGPVTILNGTLKTGVVGGVPAHENSPASNQKWALIVSGMPDYTVDPGPGYSGQVRVTISIP